MSLAPNGGMEGDPKPSLYTSDGRYASSSKTASSTWARAADETDPADEVMLIGAVRCESVNVLRPFHR